MQNSSKNPNKSPNYQFLHFPHVCRNCIWSEPCYRGLHRLRAVQASVVNRVYNKIQELRELSVLIPYCSFPSSFYLSIFLCFSSLSWSLPRSLGGSDQKRGEKEDDRGPGVGSADSIINLHRLPLPGFNTLNSRNSCIPPLPTVVQAEHYSVRSSNSKDTKFAGICKFPERRKKRLKVN